MVSPSTEIFPDVRTPPPWPGTSSRSMVKDVVPSIRFTSPPLAGSVLIHWPRISGGAASGARVVVGASVVLVLGSTVVDSGAGVEVTAGGVVTELSAPPAPPQATKTIRRRLTNRIRTLNPLFSAQTLQVKQGQDQNQDRKGCNSRPNRCRRLKLDLTALEASRNSVRIAAGVRRLSGLRLA